jgi:hypothetical protein
VNAKDEVDEPDDAQKSLSKLERVDTSVKQATMNSNDDDARAMLADLKSRTQESSDMDARNEARNVDSLK